MTRRQCTTDHGDPIATSARVALGAVVAFAWLGLGIATASAPGLSWRSRDAASGVGLGHLRRLRSSFPALRSTRSITQHSVATGLGTIDFVNARDGWAAGDVILATSDGGRTWRRQTNPAGPVGLLDFVNRNDGWALASAAPGRATDVLLRTIDGGGHWRVANEPRIGGRLYTLTRLHFTGPLLGVGVATPGPSAYYGGPGSDGRAVLTVDGGHTWQALPTPLEVSSVCFVDRRRGWAIGAGSGILLHTTNGGHSWRQSLPDGPNGATFFTLGGNLACVTAATVWALLYGPAGMTQQTYALYRTTDAGLHWQAVAGRLSIGGDPPPGTPGIPVKALHLHDNAPGTDGGPLAAVDQTTTYLGGSNAATGAIAVGGASDGGRTWHNKPAVAGPRRLLVNAYGFPGFALSFVSAHQGWLVADALPNVSSGPIPRPRGVILSTHDGGQTWQQQYPLSAPLSNEPLHS